MAKMNIKKLAADHAEKGVFGLFVLIVIAAMAGTKWQQYQGSPRDITLKVADGKRTLSANVWPEEEMQMYVIPEEAAPINIVNERLRKEFSPSQVEISGKMVSNPWVGTDPVREPTLVAPQELIATDARVFLNMFDESKLTNLATPDQVDPTGKAKTAKDESNLPDELRSNANTRLGAGGISGEMGMTQTYGSALEMSSSSDLSGMEGTDSGSSFPELKGEGYHFVSVRAVFPLREQITHYAEAIHKSFHYAAATFDIRNFKLERQTALPGDDQWSPWEAVDLQMVEDILNKVDGFDAEVVNPMITNAVITMPLPMRIAGVWDRQATHPRIEKFALSPSEIATEAEMQRKLLNEAVSQRKQMDANVINRGGFSRFTVDPRQLNQDMLGVGMFQSGGMGMAGMGMGVGMGMGGSSGSSRPRGAGAQVDPIQKLIEDMARGATNKKEEEERIRKWIQSLVSAEGELLLFRYLDFDVDPGQTYRYRVKFMLANPNYGKLLAEAGGLSDVVEGETRETPWSNITEPVTVDRDVKYFVTEVREQYPRILPTAMFDVFEWAQKHGTVVNSLLEVRFGQQFKQSKETIVIDPAKGFNEKQLFEFKSTDYLVDALEDVRIDEAFHAQADDGTPVKLPVGSRGKLPLAAKVLVAQEDNSLRFMSPILGQLEHKKQKDYIAAQKDAYAYLDQPEETSEDAALTELGLGSETEGASTKRKKSRRPKSEMRLNGSVRQGEEGSSGGGRRGGRGGP